MPEFPRADDLTLFDGLREAARLGLPVAVHAESQELTQGDRGNVKAFLASRPVLAELEAIQRATLLAGEAGAKLHIVHVSSGRGVALAAEARVRGVDVSIETCPHYLFFTEDDVERLGAVAKCAPPLRNAAEQDGLWTQVLAGTVDIVASDHSPAPPDLKFCDFGQAWGGIAGVQSTLSVLLDRGHHCRQLPLERIATLVAAEPARRFRHHRRRSAGSPSNPCCSAAISAGRFMCCRSMTWLRRWGRSITAPRSEFMKSALVAPPFWLAMLGVATAWLFFLKNTSWADAAERRFKWLHWILVNKYGFDWFYEHVLVAGARLLGGGLWRFGDQAVIDNGLVNGSARTVGWLGSVMRYAQSGYLYHYAFAMILGLASLLMWLLWRT